MISLPIIMNGRDEPVALPDPLRTVSGERIDSVQKWEQTRRGEILELFRKHVYGRIPETPYKFSFQVLKQDDHALDGQAIRKEVAITIGTAKGELTFPVLLYLPSAAKTNPVPVFLMLNMGGNYANGCLYLHGAAEGRKGSFPGKSLSSGSSDRFEHGSQGDRR